AAPDAACPAAHRRAPPPDATTSTGSDAGSRPRPKPAVLPARCDAGRGQSGGSHHNRGVPMAITDAPPTTQVHTARKPHRQSPHAHKSHGSGTPQDGDHGARRPWTVLGIALAAQILVVLDISVVNTALPTIGHSLHLRGGDLQWLVT